MKQDKIAEVLNMRSLEDADERKQAILDGVRENDPEPRPVVVAAVDDDIFNLPVEADEAVEGEVQPLAIIDTGADENLKDIELAKKNIENIISLGDSSVKEMVEIAKQSESPRAFEVVSTLMKTLLDANKDYVEMSTKKRYAKEEANPSKNEVTNNNLILSTADLLKMINGEQDKT
jgi:hypothetical protein|tara:strand:+ start:3855 stop:4382 length:528 start_codon:yes stop_codon:yes gene_type:complete